MSRMTYLQPVETSVDMITSFGGYNHNISISDGEFYDMENLSSDKFPLVSVRGKRVSVPNTSKSYNSSTADGTIDYSTMLITQNDGLYAFKSYNNTLSVFKFNESTDVWDEQCQPITLTTTTLAYSLNMGAQIVIFPAKILYNTVTKTLKPLEQTFTSNFSIALTDHNGTAISSWTSSTTEPTSPDNGDYWLDTSDKDYVLKRYSEASGMWADVQAYAKISVPNTIEGYATAFEGIFEEGDAISIPNSTAIRKAENQKYWVIYKKTSTYIMVPVMPSSTRTDSLSDATLSRTIPIFDYICESNNRLWACRYGNDGDGNTVNEIFACKLGDPTNWHYFANTSIDSYYLSLGVGGKFTGAINYQSTPVFFKEDSVHRIYGNYPANYQLKSITGYGVKDGSDKSIAELNDTVYYLSNSGITAYRGGVPVSLSEVFGAERYKDGIAASAGNKYYVSLKDSSNTRTLFVYDDRYGIWLKEDNLNVTEMFTHNTKIFCKQTDGLVCLTDFAGIDSYEDKVKWAMDTGKIGFNTPYRKFVTRVTFRLRLKLNAMASVFVQYDSDGTWQHVTDIRPMGRPEAIAVPFTPRRCDHFNLMLKGEGEVEVISFTKFYEESSDYA